MEYYMKEDKIQYLSDLALGNCKSRKGIQFYKRVFYLTSMKAPKIETKIHM